MNSGIGAPVPRREDARLLTGTGRYTHDHLPAGAAHMAVVRSPHAHAEIRSIDASRAQAMPGVLAVLTAFDLTGAQPIPSYATIGGLVDLPLSNTDGSPRRTTPIGLLAVDRVRHVGEAVVVVIARTLHEAIDAAEAVDVDYAPLPAHIVTRTADAAPALWETIPANTAIDAEFGDRAATERAFGAATHVVQLDTSVQRVTGFMMETRAVTAEYADGRFTVHCGADNSVRLKSDLAAILGVDKAAVRVIAGDVGGNYGTRNWCYPEYGLAAWCARLLGRPVVWRATRSESFLTDYQGRDLHAAAALALDADGNFLALKATLTSNVGAYTVSFVPINKTGELLTSVYRFGAAHVRARAVLTNTPPTAPYRSAGRPEAMYIIERLVELAAARLEVDALALRRRNLVPAAAMPFRTALGLTYDSGDFPLSVDRVLALADWAGYGARRETSRRAGKLRGIGFASYIEITSGFPVEEARITVHGAGTIDCVIGTTSSGQGHETSFAQCIASWLGAPLESIRMIAGDTDLVREGGGSHSARSMRMAGIVMGAASEKIIEQGRRIAGDLLEAASADIGFADGRFTLAGTDRSVGLFEVARAAGGLAASHLHKMTEPGYPYGAQVCEVEVDPETGAVKVDRYAAIDDVGRAINPLILHGQTHGGIVQGAGQALFEHAHYAPATGQMLAGTLLDYAVARADDFPAFATEIMEVPTPTNPLGVRGGGEGGTTPALAVVVNAVVDACREHGVTHLEMPLTAERVWRALHRHV